MKTWFITGASTGLGREYTLAALNRGDKVAAVSIDPEVKAFVSSLDKSKVGKIVNFGSAAMLNSTYKKVKAVADKVGIPMDEKEFHCKGEFKAFHKGRPNEEDLKAAAAFARQYR